MSTHESDSAAEGAAQGNAVPLGGSETGPTEAFWVQQPDANAPAASAPGAAPANPDATPTAVQPQAPQSPAAPQQWGQQYQPHPGQAAPSAPTAQQPQLYTGQPNPGQYGYGQNGASQYPYGYQGSPQAYFAAQQGQQGQQAGPNGSHGQYPQAPGQPYFAQPQIASFQVPPSAAQIRRRAARKRLIPFAVVGAVALVIGGGAGAGIALVASSSSVTPANVPVNEWPGTDTGTDSGTDSGTDTTVPDQGTLPDFGNGGPGGSGGYSQGGTGTSSSSGTVDATDEQQVGVVMITTELNYGEGEAAGTGIILTADGRILTNNHVIQGSTEITVTVASTGTEYTAEVVGTDSTADVAVLQLENASGLTTATLDTDGVEVGEDITGVGNAGGTGSLSAAAGTVTALESDITVQSETTGEAESLTGLIEVDADIQSGDSGGPLVDAEGEVVGIDTAASSGTSNILGYAIPIDDALDVVNVILAGQDTDTVTIGLPAFLGVQLQTSTDGGSGLGSGSGSGSSSSSASAGALVGGAIDGTPAAEAGIVAGDTITAVDGTAVASGTELSAAIAAHQPGDQVKITWTTAAGETQSATVTLTEGPAN